MGGIDSQIHKNALELGIIPDNPGAFGLQPVFQPDPPINRLLQESNRFFKDMMHIDGRRCGRLATGEGQQPSCQSRSTTRGILYDFKEFSLISLSRKALAKQFCSAHNSPQHIVEIVRHTAGQLTDGIHFLALPELFLQCILLCNIPENHYHPADTMLIIPNRRTRISNLIFLSAF